MSQSTYDPICHRLCPLYDTAERAYASCHCGYTRRCPGAAPRRDAPAHSLSALPRPLRSCAAVAMLHGRARSGTAAGAWSRAPARCKVSLSAAAAVPDRFCLPSRCACAGHACLGCARTCCAFVLRSSPRILVRRAPCPLHHRPRYGSERAHCEGGLRARRSQGRSRPRALHQRLLRRLARTSRDVSGSRCSATHCGRSGCCGCQR